MLPSFLTTFKNSDIQTLISGGHVYSTYNTSDSILLYTGMTTISGSLLSFPLNNLIYNSVYIDANFDTQFNEFTSSSLQTTSSITLQQLNLQLSQSNLQIFDLQTQLTSSLSAYNNAQSTTATLSASGDLIIQLRIELGEGSSSMDFETTFPWRPLNSIYTTQSIS